MTKDEALSEPPCKTGSQCTSKCQQCDLPAQRLPFGVGGGLVAIKTLLSRDPCAHAKTAIEMIDAMLAEQPAQPSKPLPFNKDDMEGLDINQRFAFKLGWRSAEQAHGIMSVPDGKGYA